MGETSEARSQRRDAVVRPLSRASGRPCARPACPSPATATLRFDYGEQRAQLGQLTPEREPDGYDLCRTHAERTSPPHGWQLVDQREAGDAPASTPPGGESSNAPADIPAAGDRPTDRLGGEHTVAVLAAALRAAPTPTPDRLEDERSDAASPLLEPDAPQETGATSAPVDAAVIAAEEDDGVTDPGPLTDQSQVAAARNLEDLGEAADAILHALGQLEERVARRRTGMRPIGRPVEQDTDAEEDASGQDVPRDHREGRFSTAAEQAGQALEAFESDRRGERDEVAAPRRQAPDYFEALDAFLAGSNTPAGDGEEAEGREEPPEGQATLW